MRWRSRRSGSGLFIPNWLGTSLLREVNYLFLLLLIIILAFRSVVCNVIIIFIIESNWFKTSLLRASKKIELTLYIGSLILFQLNLIRFFHVR